MLSQHDVRTVLSSWLDQVTKCSTMDELFKQIKKVPNSDPSQQLLLEQLKATTRSFIRTHFLHSPKQSRKICCAQWGLSLVPQPILIHILGFVGYMTDLISCVAINKNFQKTILNNKSRCFGPGMIEFNIPLYQYNDIQVSTDSTNRIVCTGVLTGDQEMIVDGRFGCGSPVVGFVDDEKSDTTESTSLSMMKYAGGGYSSAHSGGHTHSSCAVVEPKLPKCLSIVKGIPAIGVCLNKASAFIPASQEMNSYISETKVLEIQDGFRIDSVSSLHVEKLYLHIGYDGYHGYKNIDVDYASLFPKLSDITIEFRQFMENKRLPERFPRHLVTRINIWNVYCCGDLVQKLLETEQFPNLKWIGLDFQYYFGKYFRCTIPPIKTISIINPSNFDGLKTWMASHSVSKVVVTLLVTGFTYDPKNDFLKLKSILKSFVNVKELVVVVDVRSTFRNGNNRAMGFRSNSNSSSSSSSGSSACSMDVCDELQLQDDAMFVSALGLVPVLKDVVPGEFDLASSCGASLKIVKLLCDAQFEIGNDLFGLFRSEFVGRDVDVVRECFAQSGVWERAKFSV